jgi:ubiquitin carboxyl-terminal hydrolase 5/13
MVEDPNLANHLSHWGINMMNMEKTDRSMADLEIDLNQKYGEASMIEEANSKLKPLHGAGEFFFSSLQSYILIFRIHGYEESR